MITRVDKKARVVFTPPSLFVWIAGAFFKGLCGRQHKKKMFEKSATEVTSGTTAIHCNTHTATHTHTHTLADVLGSVSVTLLLYATV